MSLSSTAAARALPLILGGALAAVAFGAQGGTELTRTVITEVAVVVACGGVAAVSILWGRQGAIQGVTTLLLFALLAFLTALSVLWSIAPGLTYLEAGRTFAYLAIFGAAIAGARLAPQATPRVLQGLAIGTLLPVGYALISRVWPGTLAEDELSNRLGQPFGYWNAVGSVAAMGVPVLLWLGSRRAGSPAARIAAYPAMGACILAVLLTQSRGAAVAAALGAIVWFAVVPLRLRSLPLLAIPLAVAAVVGAWALSKDPFTKSLQPLSAKEAVAGDFGLLLLAMLVLLLLAGAAVNAGAARRAPSPRLRRRVGIAAVAVAVLIPLAGLTSVAFSERGIGDRLDELTSETEIGPEEGGSRVLASESSRGKYWREAFRVFDERPLAGTGAGTFVKARLRHRNDDTSVTRHAHGWVPQTMADLGLLGLGVSVLLLLAWLIAALSATGLLPRRLVRRSDDETPAPRRDWDTSRIALVAMMLVPLVFGAQSLVDWTWFVPGPTAVALVAAGFVVARGPLGVPEPIPPENRRRPGATRIAAALVAVLAAGLVAWSIWQPEAAERATDDAGALADERSYDEAIARTADAEDLNPLSPDPLLVRAAIETEAGRVREAEESLERAVLRFPGDYITWYRLAAFQLGTLDAPEQALETVQGAIYLNPNAEAPRRVFFDARARLREKTGTAEPGLNE